MNAVQIIHKHVMLRFCVILLIFFVTFTSFLASFVHAWTFGETVSDELKDYLIENEIQLDKLAGSFKDGFKYLGIAFSGGFAKYYYYNGNHATRSSFGNVVASGDFEDFKSFFYKHYAAGDDTDEIYQKWIDKQIEQNGNLPASVNSNWILYPVNFDTDYFYKNINCTFKYSFSGNTVTGTFTDGDYGSYSFSTVSFKFPFDGDCFPVFLIYSNSKSNPMNVSLSDFNFDTPSSVSGNSGTSVFFETRNTSPYVNQYTTKLSDGHGAGSFSITAYLAFKPNSGSVSISSSKGYRASSVTSSLSNSISNIGSNRSYGVIDSPNVGDAKYLYKMPYVDEEANHLILPDGSTVDVTSWTYDYNKRMYYCECSDGVIRSITYGSDAVSVSEGDTTNNYYYVTLDGVDNTSGGSTTDPDNPNPSNPDTPSSDDDDDSGSIWDKVVDAIAGLFTAIGKVIGGLLESVINLFTGIVDGITGCLDLFGSFGEFVAGFYTWMPEEWRTILAAAFTIFIGLAVVKLFRGS